MKPFLRIVSVAAQLPRSNVDTDLIIPKQYLTTITRAGLGDGLFHELRYREDGSPDPDFVLAVPPFDRAQILVSGSNFGCGSSREHAPWALLDFGIRCVIAPGFADIFYNNCCKIGLLPAVVEASDHARLSGWLSEDPAQQIAVDLVTQTVVLAQGDIPFAIEEYRRNALLEGVDEIAATLSERARIEAFQSRHAAAAPWAQRVPPLNRIAR